ncbi:hypothetical protein BDF19DRAFT_214499 [Syncephalis fuscata]|nr:hypothetical protein BDF19DRAFT_214499 [Syncephalis fuscata]
MSLQRVHELKRPCLPVRRWTADTPDTLERIYGASPPENTSQCNSRASISSGNSGDVSNLESILTNDSMLSLGTPAVQNVMAFDDHAVNISSTTMTSTSNGQQRLPPPMLQRIPAREWRRWLDELPPLKVAQRKQRHPRSSANAKTKFVNESHISGAKRPASFLQTALEQTRRVRFSLPHETIPSCYTPPISDSEYSSAQDDNNEPATANMAPFYRTSVASDVADQACKNINISPIAINEMVSELGQTRNGALELPRPSELCTSPTSPVLSGGMQANSSISDDSATAVTTQVSISGLPASREIMVAMLDRPAEMRDLFTANPEYFALVQRVLLDAPVECNFGPFTSAALPADATLLPGSFEAASTDSNAAYKQFISILFLGRNELPDRAWVHVIGDLLQGAEPLFEKFKDMVGFDEDAWEDYYEDDDNANDGDDDEDGNDDESRTDDLIFKDEVEDICSSKVIEIQRRFSESSINEDIEAASQTTGNTEQHSDILQSSTLAETATTKFVENIITH